MDIQDVLSDIQIKHDYNFYLKFEQFECLDKLVKGHSVFGQLPTGFGKSMIYTLFPLVMEKLKEKRQTALVISPLKSLMHDQASILQQHNIPCACLMENMTAESISAMKSGQVTVILSSPEAALLCLKDLSRPPLSDQICVLCFDEAHCISQWGLDFRPDYRKVADIVSHFNDIPTLVLTATATEKVYFDICNLLALPDESKLVARIPDRPNIYLHFARVVERFEESLGWMITHIKQKDVTTKKIIIYCRNIKSCENIYMWLMEELGVEAFAGASRSSSQRLVEMLHSRTDLSSSKRIIENFPKPTSYIRIVVATVAFGMGVQMNDVDIVVHWGVENSLTYWQEVGRCARDGRKGLAITYAYSRSINLCDDKVMKKMCSEDGRHMCLRKSILDQFILPGMKPLAERESECDGKCQNCECQKCSCCSSCQNACVCGGKITNVIERLNVNTVDKA